MLHCASSPVIWRFSSEHMQQKSSLKVGVMQTLFPFFREFAKLLFIADGEVGCGEKSDFMGHLAHIEVSVILEQGS